MNFGLSAYGPATTKFTKLLQNKEKGIDLLAMLRESLLQKALSEEEEEWTKIGTFGCFSNFYSHFEHSNIGYGFYAFRNESNKNISVTITLTKSLNIKISKF